MLVKNNFSKRTQLSEQLIDGLDDVRFEGSEMLSEVLLAESSRGQQLVEGFLLVRLFTATSRSAEKNRANKLIERGRVQSYFCGNTTFIFTDIV